MSPEGAADRRTPLHEAKLRTLVADRWGPAERQSISFGRGAALLASTDHAVEAWLYVADRPDRGVGAALVWADRYDVGQLQVLVDGSPDDAPGLLARQAGYFVEPAIAVWQVTGRETTPSTAAPLVPPSRPEPAPELVDALLDAGLEIVVEAGLVRGEVNGLEVARIVHGQSTAGVPLDGPALEIGVGAADRELTAMLHGDLSPTTQLQRAVPVVRRLRRADAPHHPLKQLVPERWLRAVLCRGPDAIGLAALRPAEGPRTRSNLRDRHIAVAAGETADGRPVVVACSVGVDVDLVPAAADARAAIDPEADLWLVVPERDDHPTTRRLAERLRSPARVVPVGDDWRTEA